MIIKQKSIRKLGGYLSAVPNEGKFRVAVGISEDKAVDLKRAGFSENSMNGDTLLPNPVGKVSRFNANGEWKTRKDLPKEYRITRQRVWRWTECHGRDRVERERIIDHSQWCYPREFRPPPGVELTFVNQDGQRLVVSPELTKASKNATLNRHTINLFLELFGQCFIAGENYKNMHALKIKRLAWELLPPGEQPFPKLKDFLERKWRTISGERARIILDRQYTILGFSPDEIYEGIGGFSNYLAYVFKAKGLVILESVSVDNAIYAFGKDWKELSKLTKAEILRDDLHIERIVHQSGWKKALARLLSNPDAILSAAS